MIVRILFIISLLSTNLKAFAANVPLSEDLNWKSIFISGDNSIKNFDQARIDLSELFSSYGALEENQIHFSANKQHYGQEGVVRKSTFNNIRDSFKSFNVASNDGCLIFMTSHGAPNKGFILSHGKSIKPKDFAKFVNDACGKRPTVILISACFSGQFITPELKGENRVILTASVDNRPSFGCNPDIKYTFWDGCLLEEIPNSHTWKEVYENVKICIEKKEGELNAKPSLPQAYFGTNVQDFNILRK